MFTIFIMFTITLNGNSSELSCDIFPPLEVDKTSQICLLSLQTNNSISNIELRCNTIGFENSSGKTSEVIIPTGFYELSVLELVIKQALPDFVSLFQLQGNSITLKCFMKCSHNIDFTCAN